MGLDLSLPSVSKLQPHYRTHGSLGSPLKLQLLLVTLAFGLMTVDPFLILVWVGHNYRDVPMTSYVIVLPTWKSYWGVQTLGKDPAKSQEWFQGMERSMCTMYTQYQDHHNSYYTSRVEPGRNVGFKATSRKRAEASNKHMQTFQKEQWGPLWDTGRVWKDFVDQLYNQPGI